MRIRPLLLVLTTLAAAGCGKADARPGPPEAPAGVPAAAARKLPISVEPLPGEAHLANLRQLTDGGENAEAYWSFAGDRLIFQSTRPPYTADQIYVMGPDGSAPTLVSSGKGRTTCAYFMPGDKRFLYASTHLAGDAPPPPPDRSHGYAWGLFEYEIFVADLDGKNQVRLTDSPGYDAEATVSPKGDRIVFTSSRDGDLEIYTMGLDGKDVKRLTHDVGYDGGAFFSPDGTKICYRAQHPQDDEGKARFKALLSKGIVRPDALEIMVMDADGSNQHVVTSNGKANFGPFFHPDGKRLVFASNFEDPTGRSFDVYLIGIDGKGLEPVTRFSNAKHDDFDGFPMFSPDGKRFVFCSNRNNAKPHETNVFVADWVETPGK